MKRLRIKGRGVYYVHKQKWTRIGSVDDMDAAMAAYSQFEADRVKGVAETVNDLSVKFLRMMDDPANPLELARTTIRSYTYMLRPANNLRATFGAMLLNNITPAMIGGYLDTRSSPTAANREISLLRRMYRLAMRRGWAERNPCDGIARNREKPRDRYVEDWEYRTLYDRAPERIQIAMEVSYLTGLRLGDVLRLRRSSIVGEELHVAEGKTGTRVRFEITPRLQAALDRAKALKPKIEPIDRHLICGRDGGRYTDGAFKSVWQHLQIKAVADGALQQRFTYHDLRAKHATDRDERDMDAQLALGHTDKAMTKRYIRHRLGRRVKALD